MRRRDAAALPSWTAVEEALRTARAEEGKGVGVTLPLRTITPVVGGGTEPLEPDALDFVRLPEVRGMLRWWWRALFHSGESADEIFRREAELWGAVDVPEQGGRKALKSRVRLDVNVRETGRSFAPGRHRPKNDGKPGAAARWDDQGLGYALFPLQRTDEEREAHARRHRGQPLATRSVREGLVFDLDVRLVGADSRQVEQVLLALWVWVCFGGLGARTRRGFGALEVAGEPVFSPEGMEPPATFAAGRPEAQWRRLQGLARPSARLGDGARLLLGPTCDRASGAHGQAIGLLKTFRQNVPHGRRRGHGDRPGHSNWPEADVMRRRVGIRERDPLSEGDRAADCGAPRAAFGLPLQIKFKDRADEPANATLVPTAGGRWSSPLILRPVACDDGQYRAIALFLGGAGPATVALEKVGATLPVQSAAGAQPPIRGYLDASKGNALEAFAAWLRTQGFTEAAPPRGGRS